MKKRTNRNNEVNLKSKFQKELEEYRIRCETGGNIEQQYPVEEENEDQLGGHYLEDL